MFARSPGPPGTEGVLSATPVVAKAGLGSDVPCAGFMVAGWLGSTLVVRAAVATMLEVGVVIGVAVAVPASTGRE